MLEKEYNLTEDDYRELLRESSKFYREIKESHYAIVNNMYEVFLSNGEKIKISFDEAHLPHLLGFKNLDKLEDGSRGIEVFKKMMNSHEYKEGIIKKISSKNWDFSKYISHKYYLKTKYIDSAVKAPFPKEVYFVCKFNSMANLSSSETVSYSDCDYYIGKKEKTGDISLVGFVKNPAYNTYAPRTNRVFVKFSANQELEDLLKNQVICYVSAVKIFTGSDEPTLVFLNNTDKMDVLQDLITLANKTGAIVDCASGYLFDVKKSEADKIQNSDLKETIEDIALSVSRGEIVDKDEDDLENCGNFKDVITHLISSVNNRLCSGKKNDSAIVSYTRLASDFKKLSAKISVLQSKFEKSEEEKKELLATNRKIKDELEGYRRRTEKAEKKIAKLELKPITEEKKDE